MGQYRYFLKSPGLLEKFASKTCQAFFHYKVLFLRGGEQLPQKNVAIVRWGHKLNIQGDRSDFFLSTE